MKKSSKYTFLITSCIIILIFGIYLIKGKKSNDKLSSTQVFSTEISKRKGLSALEGISDKTYFDIVYSTMLDTLKSFDESNSYSKKI